MNLKRLILTVFSTLMAWSFAAMAQWPDGDVELVNQNGGEITVRSVYTAPKSGDAVEDATAAAFNVIMTRGIPGLHNGQPMLEGDSRSFLYRFFHEKIYLRYVSGKPAKESETKIQGMKQVSVRLTIRIDAVMKMAQGGGAVINPAWTGGKGETKATASLNPSVVVVPQLSGQSQDFEAMKEALEEDATLAYAVNEISNIFAREGYKTRDVRTVLANAKTADFVNDGVQDDNRSMVLRSLPGDIVVFVDLKVTTNGNRSNCMLAIDAVEKQTGVKIGGNAFNSGEFLTQNHNELVNYSMKKIRKDFFTDMQSAFQRMVAEGRRMVIEFSLGSGVFDWDFDTPTPNGDNDFIEALEDFLQDNSCGGVYEIGQSSDKFVGASINIPIWDAEKGRGYTMSNFASALKKFLRAEIGDSYKPTVTSMGQKIFVTIQ